MPKNKETQINTLDIHKVWKVRFDLERRYAVKLQGDKIAHGHWRWAGQTFLTTATPLYSLGWAIQHSIESGCNSGNFLFPPLKRKIPEGAEIVNEWRVRITSESTARAVTVAINQRTRKSRRVNPT